MGERFRPRGTVRLRVTAVTMAMVGIVLVAGSVVLLAAQGRQVQANLDRSLEQRADDLEAELRTGRVPERPAAAGGGDPGVAQLVDADGTVVGASEDMAGRPPIASAPVDDGRDVFRTVDRLPVDDDRFRILSRLVLVADGPFTVHVASNADGVDESVAALRTSLLVGIPVLLVVLGGVTWLGVGRSLRPIEAIRAEVASIGGEERGRRVPQAAGGDEVARLAVTMNAMLDRIDLAAERQQRFVADASHELRSPLTRMRTELEVDLAHPDLAQPFETHRQVLGGVARMQRLADDLLDLARRDAGPHQFVVVDLEDLVLDEVARARPGTTVTVDASRVSAAQVLGERGALARVAANLLDNATRHASSLVSVELVEVGHEVVLAVSDDGTGVDPAQRERIFGRFVRLDDARPADGRNGLGLAIAREVLAVHGGTVSVDPDHNPGARFEVRLPRAGSDGSGV